MQIFMDDLFISGTPIFVVSGEDPDFQDTTTSPDVTYSLPRNINNYPDKIYFEIDRVTGVVSVLYPFNREEVGNWLNITVRITDTPTADHNIKLVRFYGQKFLF